jgi:hypothetical protein
MRRSPKRLRRSATERRGEGERRRARMVRVGVGEKVEVERRVARRCWSFLAWARSCVLAAWA